MLGLNNNNNNNNNNDDNNNDNNNNNKAWNCNFEAGDKQYEHEPESVLENEIIKSCGI